MINGSEIELVDDNENVEVSDNCVHQQELRILSLRAFLGISSPKTIKMRGIFGNKGYV